MGEFKDTKAKEVIRKTWCKPLLKFIHDKLKYKLIYLGLPGPQALDLLEWIEYIDQVIAFQCREYPKSSSSSQDRKKVLELEEKLRTLEREGKLSTYSIYDGYIEEVLLRGRDTNGDRFTQNDIVTIYNMDFCNGITVPLEIPDDEGKVSKYYKSDALKKLLEYQRDLSSKAKSKKFVMFFTVHSNFWREEEDNFIKETDSAPLRKYLSDIGGLKGKTKKIRLLRAYVYETIKNYFCHYGFTPEFLPVIYYKGAGEVKENWLLLFTIIGAENKGIDKAVCYQKAERYLKQKFLTVEDGLQTWEDNYAGESASILSSEDALRRSECFKRLWG